MVVKVQRPGIGEVMRGDLDLLYIAAKGLEASIDELNRRGVLQTVFFGYDSSELDSTLS